MLMALAARSWRVTALPFDKNLDWVLNPQTALAGVLARLQLVGQIVAFVISPYLVIHPILTASSSR